MLSTPNCAPRASSHHRNRTTPRATPATPRSVHPARSPDHAPAGGHLDQDALHADTLRARNVCAQPVAHVGRTLRRHAEGIQRGPEDLRVRFGNADLEGVHFHVEAQGQPAADMRLVHVARRLHGVGDGAQLQAPVTQRGQCLQRALCPAGSPSAGVVSLARPEKASLFGIAAPVSRCHLPSLRAAYRS